MNLNLQKKSKNIKKEIKNKYNKINLLTTNNKFLQNKINKMQINSKNDFNSINNNNNHNNNMAINTYNNFNKSPSTNF